MTICGAFARSSRATRLAFRNPDGLVWPIAAIAILLFVQASMIFTRAVNWDEFYHYGQLFDIVSGRSSPVLQTLYLRPYGWLIYLPGNSVDHIVVGRMIEWVFELAILALIFITARRFVDSVSSLLTVLVYLSTGYVLQHGFAFRADPMVTAVLMTAIAIFAWRKLDALLVISTGALLGLAGMLSIKAVLYAPAFGGIAWMRWRESGGTLNAALKILAIAGVAALVFVAIFLMHQAVISPQSDDHVAATAQSTALIGDAGRRMFFIGRPNNLGMIVGAIMTGLSMAACVLMAPFAIIKRGGPNFRKVALFGLLAPVLTPVFYENTAAYYYVFMLAPVAIAVSCSIALIRMKLPVILLSVLIFSLSIGVVTMENRSIINKQRKLLDTVDQLFPSPVAYFDHADIVARFDKRNPFQTPWGYNTYLQNQVPIYRNEMARVPIPLLIANWWTLREVMAGVDDHFLPEDAVALRQNYVHFSGPIWVAGIVVPGQTVVHQEFLVPGIYTVRGSVLTVDGIPHEPGGTLRLDRGMHRVVNEGSTEAQMIWGDNPVPPSPPLDSTSWVNF